MTKAVSSIEEILEAMPGVRNAVRKEISARRSAGEEIVSKRSDGIREQLAARRDAEAQCGNARKSAA